LVVLGGLIAPLAVEAGYRGRGVDRPRRAWGAALLVAGVGWLAGGPVVGLVGALAFAAAGHAAVRRGVPFDAVLVVAGAGIVLLVELVTIEGERFNVVFKAYAQVWLLWAVAAGAALAHLIDVRSATDRLPDGTGRRAAAGLTLVLVLSTGSYAALALPAHAGDPGPGVEADGPTLDATAYVEDRYPAEAAAIRWLERRDGRPTIVTAAPGGYRWRSADGEGASAPASLTGLPTVLGWFHEEQYRGAAPYDRRLARVGTIYEGPTDRGRALLDRYGVQYVYVGPAERARYDVSLPDLPVAHRSGDVTIYRVPD
jgi:uncharacterized membrane protein